MNELFQTWVELVETEGNAPPPRQDHREPETQPHQTDIMTTQDLPGHKYLKSSMTLRFRSGKVYTHAVNRAAVCSPRIVSILVLNTPGL
jgi:hypothetical protein